MAKSKVIFQFSGPVRREEEEENVKKSFRGTLPAAESCGSVVFVSDAVLKNLPSVRK